MGIEANGGIVSIVYAPPKVTPQNWGCFLLVGEKGFYCLGCSGEVGIRLAYMGPAECTPSCIEWDQAFVQWADQAHVSHPSFYTIQLEVNRMLAFQT